MHDAPQVEAKPPWTSDVSNGVVGETSAQNGNNSRRRRRRPPTAPSRSSKRQRTVGGISAFNADIELRTNIGLSAIDAEPPTTAAIHPRISADVLISSRAVPAASGSCVCEPDSGHSCRADACRAYQPGDVAIIQERYNRVIQVKLEEGGKLDTRYGRYNHDDLLYNSPGVRWCATKHQVTGSSSCAGFMHALRLGPVCWGASVSHRTQIVHAHDAALIIQRLGLRPGAHVVEAGVGSAALSAQMGWAVAPTGRVSAFEFHSERAIAARESLAVAGVPVTVTECDVLSAGFSGIGDSSADAVFLDLPRPEDVVTEAERVLFDGGRVCCFSPCVEQVQRTCANLRAGKWHSIVTITAPVRTYETKLISDPKMQEQQSEIRHHGRVKRANGRLQTRAFSEMKGHTSYLTFATKINSLSVEEPVTKPIRKEENACVIF